MSKWVLGRLAELDEIKVRLAETEAQRDWLLSALATAEGRLVEAEALLSKWLDGSKIDAWDASHAWQEVSAFLSPDKARLKAGKEAATDREDGSHEM